MNHVNGWAFPDADRFMVNELHVDGTYQVDHLRSALAHVTNRRLAIDCGAHVGTWTKILSEEFDRVIAVEPSQDTFEALVVNLTQFGCSNVDARNVAVGANTGAVSMVLDAANEARANTGARHVRDGGDTLVETIDSWQLEGVGFLKLDVEGSEPLALQGAIGTLKRCRPIVLYEQKWLWTKHYGLPKDAVSRFLSFVGYRFLEQAGCDQIWGPR